MASHIPSPAMAATPPHRLRLNRFLSTPSLKQVRNRHSAVCLSLLHDVPFLLDASTAAAEVAVSIGGGRSAYSPASYYTSLGLFVISVPGLWSLIKRSVKSKIVQKTFVMEGAGAAVMSPNQVAGEILSFFTRNNFNVTDRGETITVKCSQDGNGSTTKRTTLHDLYESQGQSPWYDNLCRPVTDLLPLIASGVRGVTSNPTIFEKAISSSSAYDEQFRLLIASGKDIESTYWELVIDIQDACKLFESIYEQTDGGDGYC